MTRLGLAVIVAGAGPLTSCSLVSGNISLTVRQTDLSPKSAPKDFKTIEIEIVNSGSGVARGIVILPDSTPGSVAGYTLDGYGGIHPFGGALGISSFAYWLGWDIARGITLSPNASKTNPAGWTLDGYGGVHQFGGAPAITNFAYWNGWDIARGIISWTGSGKGGWVLEGYGGIHPFGDAPSIAPFAYWLGWDIAVSASGPSSNTGSRRRT